MKNKFYRNTIILTVVALMAIVIPSILISAGVINKYLSYNITLAGINALLAISVNMICGITGQLSLGQAGFQALGAYGVVILTAKCGIPLPLSILLGGCFSAFAGFLIGFPTLKLEGDYLAIVTLAFGEIIRILLVNLKDVTGGPNGMSFKTILSSKQHGALVSYLVVIGILVLVIVLLQNFIRSTYGRAILAVREDEIAANSSGINIFKYKMTGFVIASFIAGISGALYAALVGYIKPELAGFDNSINGLIYVVLGGMGSVTGSVVAAFVLTLLQEFLRFLADFRLLIYPVILIIVMLFRPQGIFGKKEISFVKAYEWVVSKVQSKKTKARKNNGGEE